MIDVNTANSPLPTIWTVPDDLWEMVQCLLDRFDPPKHFGRKRIDARKALNGILYRMRTGCQWNQLPEQFGDDASIHRPQQRWEAVGLFDALWGMVLARCQVSTGSIGNGNRPTVVWARHAACQKKAADECVGKNPTDRAKPGVKKSILVEADGGPLGIAISGANTVDAQLLAITLDAVVVERPQPTEQAPQNLCLDKAYDNPTAHAATKEAGYTPHIRRIGE